MSSTTIIHITDSGIGAIERDPAGFVASIIAARHTRQPRQDISLASHFNPATVLPERHASLPRVLLLHNDLMTEFNMSTAQHYAQNGQLGLLRERLRETWRMLEHFEAVNRRPHVPIHRRQYWFSTTFDDAGLMPQRAPAAAASQSWLAHSRPA